jgi:uncharacterized protein
VESTPLQVDLAEVVGRFALRLRWAGVPVTTPAAGRFASAIQLANPQRTDELYWLGRVSLLTDRTQIEIYNRVFDDVFKGFHNPAAADRTHANPISSLSPSDGATPPTRKQEGNQSVAAGDRGVSGGSTGVGEDDDASEGMLAAASDDERLSAKPFGTCTPEELEQLRVMMGAFRVDPPMRASRRTRVAAAGSSLDLRATLRGAHRTGGDPAKRVRRERRTRPRRVVLIADVSGSMESYGRAYLYLLHGAVRAVGAEAFVFATRLHRLTRPLAMQHPANALARAMQEAPDWSGGTRIGRALAAFNDQYARRGVGRGAVVVIVSDGWESGDTALLAREMERLSRLAFHIVWVNPRKQSPRYQPLVGGMAAALPFVDTFLSGHSVEHLGQVITVIATASRSPSRQAQRSPVAPTSVEPSVDHTVIPVTSMRPDYGSLTKLSEHKRWDFTSGP